MLILRNDIPESLRVLTGRLLVPSLSAAMMTVLCLFIMQTLISYVPENMDVEPLQVTAPIFAVQPVEQARPVKEKKQRLMPSELPEDDDGLLSRPRFTVIQGDKPVLLSISEIIVDDIEVFEFHPPISGLIPVRVVQPIYPFKAMLKELEGEVVVEFSVTAAGKVINPIVLSATPESIFDKAALQAIQKFTFTPPSMDGQSYQVSGVRLKFFFKLEDDFESFFQGVTG